MSLTRRPSFCVDRTLSGADVRFVPPYLPDLNPIEYEVIPATVVQFFIGTGE